MNNVQSLGIAKHRPQSWGTEDIQKSWCELKHGFHIWCFSCKHLSFNYLVNYVNLTFKGLKSPTELCAITYTCTPNPPFLWCHSSFIIIEHRGAVCGEGELLSPQLNLTWSGTVSRQAVTVSQRATSYANTRATDLWSITALAFLLKCLLPI